MSIIAARLGHDVKAIDGSSGMVEKAKEYRQYHQQVEICVQWWFILFEIMTLGFIIYLVNKNAVLRTKRSKKLETIGFITNHSIAIANESAFYV